jgi:hypothetical protein
MSEVAPVSDRRTPVEDWRYLESIKPTFED